jgi:hypothetical protein
MKQTKAPTMVPSNRENQVQRIQLMRRSTETKLSVDDRYNEPTTMIKIKTYLYNEDSVTFKPLRLVLTNRPLDRNTSKPPLGSYRTSTGFSSRIPSTTSPSPMVLITSIPTSPYSSFSLPQRRTTRMTYRRIQPMMLMSRNITLLLMGTAHTLGLLRGRTTSPRLTPSRGRWRRAI